MRGISLFLFCLLMNASCLSWNDRTINSTVVKCPYMTAGKGKQKECTKRCGCNAMISANSFVYVLAGQLMIKPLLLVHDLQLSSNYKAGALKSFSQDNWKPPKC